MKQILSIRRNAAVVLMATLLLGSLAPLTVFGQSGRAQPATGDKKKNKRPDGTQPGTQQDPVPPDVVNKPQDADVVTVASNLVDVDAVVYNKKSKGIVTGLKKENFHVFEDGQEMEITNFATPDAPITVAVVMEYSKLGEALGYYGSSGNDGKMETVEPVATFLTQFVKPDDFVSVVAFDIRPTPLTDFTNDPRRLNSVINLLLRNSPAFKETNLFDALKFTLVGGRGDSVVLDENKSETSDYAGLTSVTNRRTAILLVASGLDTFSKINFGDTRKIIQNAGVPIYIIGTGNLFVKKYGDQLGPNDGLEGATSPGRMSFLQAANALTTFARESGGAYYPVTFPAEISNDLQNINALLRNQYSLGYRPADKPGDKQRKIVVKVDVDGDGVTDDKDYVIQHRQFYNPKKTTPPAK
jgi:VWFA-related protein